MRQSQHIKRPMGQAAAEEEHNDLKNFYLKATVCKDSLKTIIIDNAVLIVNFKVDS